MGASTHRVHSHSVQPHVATLVSGHPRPGPSHTSASATAATAASTHPGPPSFPSSRPGAGPRGRPRTRWSTAWPSSSGSGHTGSGWESGASGPWSAPRSRPHARGARGRGTGRGQHGRSAPLAGRGPARRAAPGRVTPSPFCGCTVTAEDCQSLDSAERRAHPAWCERVGAPGRWALVQASTSRVGVATATSAAAAPAARMGVAARDVAVGLLALAFVFGNLTYGLGESTECGSTFFPRFLSTYYRGPCDAGMAVARYITLGLCAAAAALATVGPPGQALRVLRTWPHDDRLRSLRSSPSSSFLGRSWLGRCPMRLLMSRTKSQELNRMRQRPGGQNSGRWSMVGSSCLG